MRPHFQWQLGSRSLSLGERTLVMGVLNVTPDSFSDGGDFETPESALAHAMAMLQSGADIIDIGGESTRPGKKVAVTAEDEKARILPVIRSLLRLVPEAIISIDTYKSEVAKAAVDHGATIVNDVSGLRWDEQMASTLATLKCGVILMHMRGRPEEWRDLPADRDIVATVKNGLQQSLKRGVEAGVAKDRIVLDPGFGFGKNFDENYPLLAHFDALQELGCPLMSGTSRKSFIGRTLARHGKDLSPKDRLIGTMASVTASVLSGTHIVRVHDVPEAVQTVQIADAILEAEG